MSSESKIAERVKEARENAGMTQAELAKLMEVSRSEISTIERGQTTQRERLLQNICELLDIETLIGKSA